MFVCKLSLFLLVSVSAAVGCASSDPDPLTTCTVVQEGKTTRAVALRPFRPVGYLRSQLDSLPEPNRSIVRMALAYPRNGHHRYWWPKVEGLYDGCTTDVYLGRQKVMSGEPGARTFCCGLTLELCYRAMVAMGSAPDNITSDSAPVYRYLWFCRKVGSPGPEEALREFGLGRRITSRTTALPGDFVQLWRRNGSGHSVMFVSWLQDLTGKPAAVCYWSTQPATAGIDFAVEPLKALDLGRTTIARLGLPDKWRQVAAAGLIARFPLPENATTTTVRTRR